MDMRILPLEKVKKHNCFQTYSSLALQYTLVLSPEILYKENDKIIDHEQYLLKLLLKS